MKAVLLSKGGLIMAEGYSIDFGRFSIGIFKSYTSYGKCVTKEGTIYQFWKFFIWMKE